jgi:hypothetical protein
MSVNAPTDDGFCEQCGVLITGGTGSPFCSEACALEAGSLEDVEDALDPRCENAGCGSGAWLTDDWECSECGWRPV